MEEPPQNAAPNDAGSAALKSSQADLQKWFSFKTDSEFHTLLKLAAVSRRISMTELFETAVWTWFLIYGTEEEKAVARRRTDSFANTEKRSWVQGGGQPRHLRAFDVRDGI